MKIKCPRCESTDMVMSLTATMTLANFSGDEVTVKTFSDGSDGFLDFGCRNCGLTLAGELGDGRLRRAALYGSTEAAESRGCDEAIPPLDESTWSSLAGPSMRQMANYLCEQSMNLDTEVINVLAGD